MREEIDLDSGYFELFILKPSNLVDIWSTFKVKNNMMNFLQWYFRPKNSFEPERIDYNALNILAEYQTFNFEFCKNELDLTNEQCANVLHGFWELLEFNPDEKSIERDLIAVKSDNNEQPSGDKQ